MPTILETLKHDAKISAQFRGHDLVKFKHFKDDVGSIRRAISKCKNCGAGVSVNAKPYPNEIDISGMAIGVNCPFKENDNAK